MKNNALIIHPRDNVAVALTAITAVLAQSIRIFRRIF